MKKNIFANGLMIILVSLLVVTFVACNNKENDPAVDTTDDVVEIAIRQVKTGQQNSFEQARSNFISLLKQQKGVLTDREYASFFHYNPAQDTTRSVFVGMTQYEDLETFQRVGNDLGNSAELGAFFGTFDVLTFTALKPLKAGTEVDISKLASAGQVLEIAVRDISKYANFSQADYEAKRDAFLDKLAQQSGRVAEYQWQSVLDPNIVVGMTVYESQQSFFGILSNQDFAGSAEVQAFLGAYPPNAGGEICTVVN